MLCRLYQIKLNTITFVVSNVKNKYELAYFVLPYLDSMFLSARSSSVQYFV